MKGSTFKWIIIAVLATAILAFCIATESIIWFFVLVVLAGASLLVTQIIKKHLALSLIIFFLLLILFITATNIAANVQASYRGSRIISYATLIPTHSPEDQAQSIESDQTLGKQTDSCKELKKFDENISRWCPLIIKYAKKYDLDPVLVASIIQVESGGNQDSISYQGAVGIMQVMSSDSGWAFFANRPTKEELLNPKTNIDWGCKILSGFIGQYGNVRDGLMHYGPMDYGYTYADQVLSLYAEKSN